MGKMDADIEQLMRAVAVRSSHGESPLAWEECDDGTRLLDCDPLGEFPLGDDWLFRAATEDEALRILSAFLEGGLDVGYSLECQLARLLAEKGDLVASRIGKLVKDTDWSSYGTRGLVLAGLGHVTNGDGEIIRLLDVVPEDARDGIFLACWKSRSHDVQAKLLCKFEEWMIEPDWGGGTGEGGWLGKFIAKWLGESAFDIVKLHQTIKWYFENIVRR